MILIIFWLLIITSASSLSFNYSTFDPNDHSIRYEGQAAPLLGAIQLTENRPGITGHATYDEPLHLWDKISGNLASFVTNFSYSVDAQNNTSHSDGFAFFMANLRFRIPDAQQGSGIGLASGNETLNSTANPFIAVEFDTYHNGWDDEAGDHVGIDVSSLKSSKSLEWFSVLDGRIMDASITFDSVPKTLCAYFTGIAEGFQVQQKLCYEIDPRDYLPEFVWIGFSAATGLLSELHRIHSWSFDSYFPSAFPPSSSPPPPPPPSSTSKDKKNNTLMIVGFSVAGVASLILLALIISTCIYFNRTKNIQVQKEENMAAKLRYDFDGVNGPKSIAYDLLLQATDNFSEEKKLGEGGFGKVFQGSLAESNKEIAVKRIIRNSTEGIAGYVAEVTILSQLRHKNLVELIGWCHEEQEYILLVYEFLPQRSLDFHLYKPQYFLDWQKRYNIIQGIASGLRYLHNEWKQLVLHRDIKSSNVMLDSDFNPMLGDFGLARIVDHDVRSQTHVGGSRGYIAPECFQTGRTTKESDVFSFGVVALELACARKTCVENPNGFRVHIVEWVWRYCYENGNIFQAVDGRLNEDYNREEMERLLKIGLWCGHPDPLLRPSMEDVVDVLRARLSLPDPPLQYPTDHPHPSTSLVNGTFVTAESRANTEL